jgi:hypothetical protein
MMKDQQKLEGPKHCLATGADWALKYIASFFSKKFFAGGKSMDLVIVELEEADRSFSNACKWQRDRADE